MQDNLHTKTILDYKALEAVPAGTSDEALVDVRTYDPTIIARYNKRDMISYTGDVIFVRETLAKKLAAVNQSLRQSGCCVKVVYGYRHPAVQKKYFTRRRNEVKAANPQLSDQELDGYTHNFVAIPSIAGHPTGGAIDVTLCAMSGDELDMGTAIADYADPKKIQTFTASITKKQHEYRMLLHDAMVAKGFAPFYGEWWHFSYGDREWAAFYYKKTALFGAVMMSDQLLQ